MYLIDTSVIYEFMQRKSNTNLIKWLQAQKKDDLYLSALTLEIVQKQGHNMILSKIQEQQLEFDKVCINQELTSYFLKRILPVIKDIKKIYHTIQSKYKHDLDYAKGIIAASAVYYDLIIVTVRLECFVNLNVRMINPTLSTNTVY